MSKKRPPADSASEQARYAKGAFRNVEPPKHFKLSNLEREFFDGVVDEIAKADWTRHKIDLACMIAKTMAAIVDAQKELDTTGMTIRGANGTLVMSPHIGTITKLSGIVAQLRRTLGLQADGRNINTGKRTKIAKDAERRASRAADDDEDGLLGSDEEEDDSGLA